MEASERSFRPPPEKTSRYRAARRFPFRRFRRRTVDETGNKEILRVPVERRRRSRAVYALQPTASWIETIIRFACYLLDRPARARREQQKQGCRAEARIGTFRRTRNGVPGPRRCFL
jgi:hypothetical protein